LSGLERELFVRELVQAAGEITPAELGILFEGGWRERKTASWLVVVADRTEFRSRTGELDPVCRYLERYLLRRDLRYDQTFALSALLHFDAVLGTERAPRYLAAGGLWQQRSDARPGMVRDPQEWRQVVAQLCSFAGKGAELLAGMETGR
jgi:hypothetical protein